MVKGAFRIEGYYCEKEDAERAHLIHIRCEVKWISRGQRLLLSLCKGQDGGRHQCVRIRHMEVDLVVLIVRQNAWTLSSAKQSHGKEEEGDALRACSNSFAPMYPTIRKPSPFISCLRIGKPLSWAPDEVRVRSFIPKFLTVFSSSTIITGTSRLVWSRG